MGGSTVVVGWPLGVALAVLVVLTVAASLLARFDTARQSAVAAVRAIVQLGAVAAVILAVVRSWWSTALFVSLMVGVATWTSARRMTRARSGLLAGVALMAGTVPVLAVVLATGTVPLTGIAVVPIAGIVVGGAMTATSVAGRRALDQLQTRRGEYEAALSLGFLPRDAALLVVRASSTDALVPPLDQTRTVGLVTLPGAFVGVLLGSGDPVQAGAAQILVLIGLLAAETLAVWVVLELVARGRITRT
ncbi:ABC transporter permease [Pseudonocardia oroxyli]|uniref:Putative ABC transport system permease protein n=1 Tax=Pseudonocardia oroxyli TaxID=366584 RepID=A0A1G7XVU6_PSEOR|nr:ABC transporter permease [Pseudonocardia oroxyli]SDG88281.1 putative ABC transport system permease protein [Pseudonocardia oroxyli]